MPRVPNRLTFTLTEAAAMLGISERTAFRRVQDGALPIIRIGSAVRINRSVLEGILDGSGGTLPRSGKPTA